MITIHNRAVYTKTNKQTGFNYEIHGLDESQIQSYKEFKGDNYRTRGKYPLFFSSKVYDDGQVMNLKEDGAIWPNDDEDRTFNAILEQQPPAVQAEMARLRAQQLMSSMGSRSKAVAPSNDAIHEEIVKEDLDEG